MKFDKQLEQSAWERMRFQTVALINSERKRKDQIKLKDLAVFEWEKELNHEKIKADRKKVQFIMAQAQKEFDKKAKKNK